MIKELGFLEQPTPFILRGTKGITPSHGNTGNLPDQYILSSGLAAGQPHRSRAWEEHVRVIRALRAKLSGSSLVRFFSRRAKQLSIRYKIDRIRATGNKIKIVVGADPTTFLRWISTDLPVLNALRSSDWFLAIPRSSVYRLLFEHVVEHWSEKDFPFFFKPCERRSYSGWLH